MDLSFEVEVDNGIKFLSQRLLVGWATLVDLDTLDLSAGDQCMLAQTEHTTFGQALRRLAGLAAKSPEGRAWAMNHGFILAIPEPYNVAVMTEAYARLTETWRVKIRELTNDGR